MAPPKNAKLYRVESLVIENHKSSDVSQCIDQIEMEFFNQIMSTLDLSVIRSIHLATFLTTAPHTPVWMVSLLSKMVM